MPARVIQPLRSAEAEFRNVNRSCFSGRPANRGLDLSCAAYFESVFKFFPAVQHAFTFPSSAATTVNSPIKPRAALFFIRAQLDTYVGLNFNNWQATFAQQSLWWGPGNGGPMLYSNN